MVPSFLKLWRITKKCRRSTNRSSNSGWISYMEWLLDITSESDWLKSTWQRRGLEAFGRLSMHAKALLQRVFLCTWGLKLLWRIGMKTSNPVQFVHGFDRSLSIGFTSNPLTRFVELPDEMSNLQYSNVYCGIIRGALEMVHVGFGLLLNGRCVFSVPSNKICWRVRRKMRFRSSLWSSLTTRRSSCWMMNNCFCSFHFPSFLWNDASSKFFQHIRRSFHLHCHERAISVIRETRTLLQTIERTREGLKCSGSIMKRVSTDLAEKRHKTTEYVFVNTFLQF